MKKVSIVLLALFLSHGIHAQFELKGKYGILLFNHFSEDKTIYKNATRQESNCNIVFYEDRIGISVEGYIVDLLKYPTDEKPKGDGAAKTIKMWSSMDAKEKTVLLNKIDEDLFELWVERGNGGFDIFGITKTN